MFLWQVLSPGWRSACRRFPSLRHGSHQRLRVRVLKTHFSQFDAGDIIYEFLWSCRWCIFVYNLAPETEENILWQLFGPFGAVQNVKVKNQSLSFWTDLILVIWSGDPRLADEQVQGLWLRHHDQLRGGSCRHSGSKTQSVFFTILLVSLFHKTNAFYFQSLNGYTLGNRVLQVSFKTNNRKV